MRGVRCDLSLSFPRARLFSVSGAGASVEPKGAIYLRWGVPSGSWGCVAISGHNTGNGWRAVALVARRGGVVSILAERLDWWGGWRVVGYFIAHTPGPGARFCPRSEEQGRSFLRSVVATIHCEVNKAGLSQGEAEEEIAPLRKSTSGE